ncbi:MAG: succinate dehydrogenase, cytochrome b556 subunit [Pseudomonadota bacterium]
MAGTDTTDPRPLSPHLQVWRYHATMIASISHRVTGVGLYGGALIISAWIVSLGMGETAYSTVHGLIISPVGLVLLFLFTVAVLFHFANGMRHLIWDGPGIGFSPKVASAVSVFNFAFAALGAAAIWAASYLIGN